VTFAQERSQAFDDSIVVNSLAVIS
jgi:hypothetical protein